MQLSKLTHGIIQGIAFVLQYANLASGVVPAHFQPLAASVISLLQMIVALSQHGQSAGSANSSGNSSGTGSAKAIIALLFVAFCLQPAHAQNMPSATSTFSLNATAIALPGNVSTVAGTDVGGTFQLTKNLYLRSDNIISPGNFEGFYGGVQYWLPLSSLLQKTILNPEQFGCYATGSVGVDRIVTTGQSDQQHYSELAGGGCNYDPTGSGHFSVNLFEARWLKAPGFNNSTAVISTGFTLGW